MALQTENRKGVNSEVGRAEFNEILAADIDNLLSGNWPPFAPAVVLKTELANTVAPMTVVALDATKGTVVAAKKGTPAIGVIYTAPSDGTVLVLRSGCFNPDALIWDASYASYDDKKVAFEGAPTPTQIIVRQRPNNVGITR